MRAPTFRGFLLTWLVVLVPSTVTATSSPLAREQRSPAQRSGEARDLLVRVNGSAEVPVSDTIGAVWVVNGDVRVDGVVREGVGVVNGTTRIAGHVTGSVMVVNGHLELLPGARVDEDIVLQRGTISRAPSAVVGGVIRERPQFSLGGAGIGLVWLGFTIVVVAGGLLFAALAPSALVGSAEQLTEHGMRSALAALFLIVAMPAAAVVGFVSVLGIPLGLTILLVAIPALSFLGYVVSAVAIASKLLARGAASSRAGRYVEVVVGVLLLQTVALLPVLGGLVALIASQIGAGAFVARVWAMRRSPGGLAATAPLAA